MPAWPITLPIYPLTNGYVEHIPDTTIRTEMDQGPAKIRQRTTAGVGKFQISFLLTKNQVTIFDDFFLNTLSGGSLSFDFTHPRTDEVVQCRFVSAPQYAATNGNYFKISADLEVLP